jgi:hypothetical protein
MEHSFRTAAHHDGITLNDEFSKLRIMLATVGSDSDDDDMSCYVTLNEADTEHLIGLLQLYLAAIRLERRRLEQGRLEVGDTVECLWPSPKGQQKVITITDSLGHGRYAGIYIEKDVERVITANSQPGTPWVANCLYSRGVG